MSEIKDTWSSGEPYEYFMGRWSTMMAPEFLKWLDPPSERNWLDIGCGTGALSEAIIQMGQPKQLSCIDPSENFIEKVKSRISLQGAFKVGSAENIPFENESFEIIVSGLALNFFPNLERALTEMKRVLKPNGVVASYVWDYAGRMDFLRYFWDAAFQIDPGSKELDEGVRFPICHSDNLFTAFQEAGLQEIEFTALDIDTVFINFDDYWKPFLGGQGPAPGYLAALSDKARNSLKNDLRERLPIEPNGSISLIGRALAIKGTYTI